MHKNLHIAISPERRILNELEMWSFDREIGIIGHRNPSRNPRRGTGAHSTSSSENLSKCNSTGNTRSCSATEGKPRTTPCRSTLSGVRLWMQLPKATYKLRGFMKCSGRFWFVCGIDIVFILTLRFVVVLRGIWNWVERSSGRWEMSWTWGDFELVLVCIFRDESTARNVSRHCWTWKIQLQK